MVKLQFFINRDCTIKSLDFAFKIKPGGVFLKTEGKWHFEKLLIYFNTVIGENFAC